MNDPRKIVLTALCTALASATGLTIYTKIPKQAAPIFPYIHISDVFMEEEGTKAGYQYKYQILIEVVHKDDLSDGGLFDNMNEVCSVITNGVPFSLTGGYKVMDCTLVSSTQQETLTEVGLVDVGAIRIMMRVE